MIEVIYRYVEDGVDRSGKKIPDIPVAWIILHRRKENRKMLGPCVVDTGFDGGIYANAELSLNFEGIPAEGTEWFYGAGDRDIECDVYSAECFLLSGEETVPLGEVMVYIPVRVEDLPEETIMGREVLNTLTVVLDGKNLRMGYEKLK
ncbi:MAG: hypothetical protein KIH10_13305 [Candidatus Freyarchaeota archaeon]|nr:hypothetical protein [Candidatus Jordarchaeia archaeon]MBS7280073.1 hypothetical protein [Candidatus Jordarchaeia archaeon]